MTVVIGAAAWELVERVHEAAITPAGLIVSAAHSGSFWGPFFRGPAAYPYVLGLIVITTLMWFLVVHPGDQPVMNIGATLFGTLYVGGLGSFAALMAGYPNYVDIGKVNNSKYGIGLLVAAIFSRCPTTLPVTSLAGRSARHRSSVSGLRAPTRPKRD